jgi:hypothetical protein
MLRGKMARSRPFQPWPRAVSSSALRVLPPGTLVTFKAIRESSSHRPVLEELGAQCIPRISRLVGFFDRFISLLPGPLFKECLLDINLGGMHFVKCLGDGLHVFWRHCGFGHGPNRTPFKLTRRFLSAFLIRSANAKCRFQLDQPEHGEIRLEGHLVSFTSPRPAMERGIGFVSSNRQVESLAMNLSVRENFFLNPQNRGFRWYQPIHPNQEKSEAEV